MEKNLTIISRQAQCMYTRSFSVLQIHRSDHSLHWRFSLVAHRKCSDQNNYEGNERHRFNRMMH